MWLLKLEGSSGSLSSKLLQAGSTVKSHQAAQNFCWSGLENLRRRRLHSLTADCLHDENVSSFLISEPLLCWSMPSLTFFHLSVMKGSIIFKVSSLASKDCYQVPAEPSLPRAESGPSLHLSPQGSWSSSLYLSGPLLHLLQFNIIFPVLGKPQTGQVPTVSTIDWMPKVYGTISFPRVSKSITLFSLTLSYPIPTLTIPLHGLAKVLLLWSQDRAADFNVCLQSWGLPHTHCAVYSNILTTRELRHCSGHMAHSSWEQKHCASTTGEVERAQERWFGSGWKLPPFLPPFECGVPGTREQGTQPRQVSRAQSRAAIHLNSFPVTWCDHCSHPFR